MWCCAAANIHHIAIGPDGVIVVETKWTSSRVRLDGSDRWLGDAVTQVRENANDIRKVLGWNAFHRRRRRSARGGVGSPGPTRDDELVPGGDGVELVAGEDLHLTLDVLGHRALTGDQIDDAYRKITQHVTRRDAREADNEDSDRLITTMARRWAVRLGAFLAGFGVAALLLNLGSGRYLAASVVVVAVGVLLRRDGPAPSAEHAMVGRQPARHVSSSLTSR